MTREQKVEYVKQNLPELTTAQQNEIDKAIIWGSTADFPQFVAAAKEKFSKQATVEEIGVVMSHLQGAGNNASKQFFADQAFKKKKETADFNTAVSGLRM